MTKLQGVLVLGVAALGLACVSGTPKSQEGELLAVNGTELFVKRIGSGDPIIVVHGGPVLEHGYLLPHLEPLTDTYELIFYDQRLSGRSAGTVDSSTVRLSTFVGDIEALRRTLRLDRVHVIAHSWGGLLAMNYAIQHSDRVRSLILLNPIAASAEQWRAEEAVLAQRMTEDVRVEMDAIRSSEAMGRGDADAIKRLLLASYKMAFHDRAFVDDLDLYVPEDYNSRSRQFGYMMQDLLSFDLYRELQDITTRTLIVYGADEPAVQLGAVSLNEALQHSEMLVIERAGHFPFIERKDVTLSEVRSFLSGS